MEGIDERAKRTSQNKEGEASMRMSGLLINEDENEEEAPIDFGIEPTTTLAVVRKPPAPRNLKKDKKCSCCNIL